LNAIIYLLENFIGSKSGVPVHARILYRHGNSGHHNQLFKIKKATLLKNKILAKIWNESAGKLDVMGIVMLSAMINLCIILPICWLAVSTIMIVIFPVGLLPLQIVVEELIEANGLEGRFQASLLRYWFQLALCSPLIVEGFRALPLILIFLVIPIQLYLRCIQLCKDFEARENALGCGRKFRLLFHNYDKVRILNNEGQSYVGLQVSFLLFVGTALSVIANFTTIRAFQIFPWYLYVFCPSLSILILLIIQLLLPFGINCHENSEAMLRQWKSNPIYAKGKYLRRKLKSLRSLRWYAGLTGFYECNFFLIQDSFKTAYYAVILDYTINLILFIPASAVAGFTFT
jgi:hypothetical protein